MAMTAQEQKDLRDYCAILLKEYGILISPDDPVIPALYIFYKHTKSVSESNQVLALQVRGVLSKVRPREFHFHHPGEAWKFQLAAAFKWTTGALLTFVFVLIGAWQWSRLNDVQAAKAILQSSGNMGLLFHRVTKDDQGNFFIDFTAANGDSIKHFTEYERLNKKAIRIYVGRDSSNIKN